MREMQSASRPATATLAETCAAVLARLCDSASPRSDAIFSCACACSNRKRSSRRSPTMHIQAENDRLMHRFLIRTSALRKVRSLARDAAAE